MSSTLLINRHKKRLASRAKRAVRLTCLYLSLMGSSKQDSMLRPCDFIMPSSKERILKEEEKKSYRAP